MPLTQSDLDNIAQIVRVEIDKAQNALVKRLINGREGLHKGLSAGGGLTHDEIKEAMKDAQREGTG